MGNNKISTTVSANWLNKNSKNQNLIILDASIKPKTVSVNNNNINEIIPNSKKFDLKKIFSDLSSPYDHTLPNISNMLENVRKLGIKNNSEIVIYDNQGIYSSPRVFFMLKSLGHNNISILDGGLIDWKNEGYPVENSYLTDEAVGDFSINNTEETYRFFCDSQYVLNHLSDSIIIDVRSHGRFYGIEKEPRDNLKSGHIPNSINIPFEVFLENGKLKSDEKLKAIFSEMDISKELIFSCGSGVTSCIGALGAIKVGIERIKVYDGSWMEWGNISNTFPIEL
ncbi:sulfurtransferase [Chryseobacterium oryzae]|uniref:Sulfurtransferase n=1 Tax=Chryseobacterium oryzae TaxID=2929799 RepID=A0ABY4BF22_9FLAO|nr:sulfurtransferase [Chryseobacterium oryzae]UOE37744.1 sulfurtransferase [Chryseobacterium oryzae]